MKLREENQCENETIEGERIRSRADGKQENGSFLGDMPVEVTTETNDLVTTWKSRSFRGVV